MHIALVSFVSCNYTIYSYNHIVFVDCIQKYTFRDSTRANKLICIRGISKCLLLK